MRILRIFLHLGLASMFMVLSSSARAALPNSEYNIPLLFDVEDNGIKIAPMTTAWDLSKQNSLNISDVEFSEKTFRLDIKRFRKVVPKENLIEKDELNEWVLVMQWPAPLFDEGMLEALDRSGKVIWQRDIKRREMEEWRDQVNVWKRRLVKLDPKFNISNHSASKINVVLRQFKQERQPFWTIEEPFKFCLSHDHDLGLRTRICTAYYESVREEKEIYFDVLPTAQVPARVIAFNENQKLKDEKEVALNQPVQFFAELTDGSTFEYIAKPVRFNVIELVESVEAPGEKDMIQLKAWGPRPNIPVQDFKSGTTGVSEKWLGRSWGKTIGDMREFWQVKIPKEKPILYVPGIGGGLFKVQFQITNLPLENLRPYLSSKTVESTYSESPEFSGKMQGGMRLSTKMNSIKMDSIAKDIFTWNYSAKKKGGFNKSTVQVFDGKNTFVAYREVYRGYSGEAFLRASGLVSSMGGMSIASELGLRYWFESIAGWQNYVLSRQRWGVSYRDFTSYNPLQFGNNSDNIKYKILDINYRLNPGVWGWDETWGLTVSNATMNYSIFQNQMLGVGFFWGRSMPLWLDEILNYIPFNRKPKWVHLEYIYYPVSQTPRVHMFDVGTGLGNWVFNISSKLMHTPQFYSELGLGIRQSDFYQEFTSPVFSRQRFQFTSMFGSIAVGWNF